MPACRSKHDLATKWSDKTSANGTIASEPAARRECGSIRRSRVGSRAAVASQAGPAVAAPAGPAVTVARPGDAVHLPLAWATARTSAAQAPLTFRLSYQPSQPASRRASYRPPDHALHLGSRGPAVRRMQRRLRALKYQPGRADGVLGPETLAAVWAFERVQGVRINARNADTVSRRVLRMLVHPRLPKVFEPHGGHNLRVEVNLADEI